MDFMFDYWNNACAMCGSVEDNFRVIAHDHWIPIFSILKCPGTVIDNMVPLCHGKKGCKAAGIICCNNSKARKDPIIWLIERFGYDLAETKLAAIEAYFALAKEHFPS